MSVGFPTAPIEETLTPVPTVSYLTPGARLVNVRLILNQPGTRCLGSEAMG
jgi:hypothetical protein